MLETMFGGARTGAVVYWTT